VALAEDRDRRADAPDEGNRCYAEKAPRRRDLAYQAEYCYTTRFGACSVFLAWAARSAAEPAHISEAARRAWGTGIAMPEPAAAAGPRADDAWRAAGDAALPGTWLTGASTPERSAPGDPATAPGGFVPEMPSPSVEGGLFGPPDPSEAGTRSAAEPLDWVSASAWADAPWDPSAEDEEDEDDADAWADVEHVEPEDLTFETEEALRAPKVPAALPMRRRPPPSEPIRARGSGEWLYADPPAREPLARRRGSVGPPVMLAVLGLLVVSLVAFLLPTLLGGGGGDGDRSAALMSPSPGAAVRLLPTRAPERTPGVSPSPSPTPEPEIRVYVVKQGDTLSGIASKTKVNLRLLQCINGLANPNMLSLGQELLIPPDGYACPPGWRRGASATPAADAAASVQPAASPSPSPAA
jgi:LysM repeat protein